ncbi:WAT1-related protein At5g40230-like isoform X2 [Pistacia vera]|uniref:WAT1-related protein At5g40230-like isoform X2 n=1 Tax=Pistacia vera TaxID=55513 RepID=UPI00126333D5|nr:WAT1-related protein At5g40230-like isoform X2 [Pistacia vera]
MDRRNLWKEILLFAAMVSLECSGVGLTVIYKEATLKGMSNYVFVTYSFAIATLVLLPFAFYFRMSTSTVLPSVRFPFIFRICLLGLTGSLAMILGYKGIAYSSPTLASAMSTLTPAFTFTLAVIFRMEKLILRSAKTQAKIIGTIASISGALVVVLYEGPTILSSSAKHPTSLQFLLGSSLSSWVIGGLLLSVEYLLFSFWYIIQTEVIKMYPSEFEVVFLYNLISTIICAVICFTAETNLSAWRLSSDIAIVAIIYSGLLGSSLGSVVHTWGLRIKGPIYVTSFKPLSIAIVAVMGFIFLGDALYLGSVVGGVIICVGFYGVLWGKASEGKNEEDSSIVAIDSKSKTPLLQSIKAEETREAY